MQKNNDSHPAVIHELTKAKLIVQKYGGATLATPTQIKQAALRIFQLHQTGTQVVAVVSAMGQTTNQLIELARNVSPNPHLRELDMLLTTGERISMSLLSMALNDLGAKAISYTGSQAGILTDDSHVNASIIDVKAFRVEEALQQNKIVILAGFQGVSANTKEITTLGRGGSDTSAVAIAGYLKADRCEILKDVDSIYTADPKLVTAAKKIPYLNYTQLLDMTKWGAKVLHHKSVEMAQLKNVPLYVGSAAPSNSAGTLISNKIIETTAKYLAINSFAQVLQLEKKSESTTTLIELFNFLKANQIAPPEILHQEKNSYFISGAAENLHLIETLNLTPINHSLIPSDLCSVSITCKETPTAEIQSQVKAKMQAAEIKVESCIISERNINFLIHQKEKIKAIQLLHSLIG